jgi:hypothetical protein
MPRKRKMLIGVGILAACSLLGGVSFFLHSRNSMPAGPACLTGRSALTHSCGPFGPELVEACNATNNPHCRQASWERQLIVSLSRQLPQPHTNCMQPGEEPWIWACGPFDSAFAEICRTKVKAGDICSTNRWHRELLARTMAAAFPAPLRPGPRPILILREAKEKWSLALVSDYKTLAEIPVNSAGEKFPNPGVWWVLESETATNGLVWENGIGNLNAQPNAVSVSLIQRTAQGFTDKATINTDITKLGINITDTASKQTFVSWFSDPGASPRALWIARGKQREPSHLDQRAMRDVPTTLKTSK